MFEGLRWTTPLAAGAVFTLTPFMTAILGLFIANQRLGLASFICLLVAGLASLLIMFGGDLAALKTLRIGRGELIFLVGCAAYAGYAPAVKKLHNGHNGQGGNGGHSDNGLVYLTLWTLVAGCVLLVAYGWKAIIQTNWHLVSPLVYLAIGWLALFTTAITFYLIQYAALRLPAVKVMSYTLLIPAFILVQRLANGGTWPNASVLIALAVLGGAMLILQRV